MLCQCDVPRAAVPSQACRRRPLPPQAARCPRAKSGRSHLVPKSTDRYRPPELAFVSLVQDLHSLRSTCHGSEGWEFESLRARWSSLTGGLTSDPGRSRRSRQTGRSRFAGVCSRYMRTPAPPLLAVFRSQLQGEVLARVLLAHDSITIADLARELEAPLATVAREVNRLKDAGILSLARQGRAQLVTGNDLNPAVAPLRDLVGAGTPTHRRSRGRRRPRDRLRRTLRSRTQGTHRPADPAGTPTHPRRWTRSHHRSRRRSAGPTARRRPAPVPATRATSRARRLRGLRRPDPP
jgi:DNA-binding transcriptional ArsR family regulator